MRLSLLAAAALLLAAGCTSSSAGKPHHSGAAGVVVECTSSRGGNASADRAVLAKRAQHLTTATPTVLITNSEVHVTVPGASAASVRQLCQPGNLNFRAVVAPAVRAGCGGCAEHLVSAGPLAKSDAEFDKLSSAEQHTIEQRLASFECASSALERDASTRDFLACDSKKLVYLLGPAIVSGNQIQSATANAPNSAQGGQLWTISLTLDAAGARAWAAYTTAHNTGGTIEQSATPTNCGPTSTPCSDYVAFVLDGTAVSVPVTQEPINGVATQISGSFTESSAKALAASLDAGALPVPLTFDQVTRN